VSCGSLLLGLGLVLWAAVMPTMGVFFGFRRNVIEPEGWMFWQDTAPAFSLDCNDPVRINSLSEPARGDDDDIQ